MGKLQDHPTVRAYRAGAAARAVTNAAPIDAARLREICLAQGADDVGFVSIDHADVADQRARILEAFPRTKTLVSYLCRVLRDNVRSPLRSISNLEFKRRIEHVNAVGRNIAVALEPEGIRALNPAAAYPMEMDGFPDVQMWIVSHKPVAVAAGLGLMGRHRLVTHPRFGSFIPLGTVLIDAEVSQYGQRIDFDPCVECQYCVAVCPVGAVGEDGHFNFSACLTHCYRDNLGGFIDWSERVAAGGERQAYRRRIPDPEAATFWQSLIAGPSFRTSYCMAVCPAGEDVIGPYLDDRKAYLKEVVKPLQALPEKVFVAPGSDAEAHVVKRFPHKQVRRVGNGVRPQTIAGFLKAAPIVFQRHRSDGLSATYHFTFTGLEPQQATVTIKDKTIQVEPGHVGSPDIAITADSQVWLDVLAQQRSPVWAIVTRQIKLKGPAALFQRLARCFA
jgi:ferredoxin